MIRSLSNMKGGFRNGKWDPKVKPSDYGAATLTLVTPENTTIEEDLINYARDQLYAILDHYIAVRGC